MTTLTLNSTQFSITGYNRYTTIDDSGVHSVANVNFPNNSQYDALTQVGEIESMSIVIDGSTVYSLPSTEAKVTNISEYLTESGVTMNAQITFENVTE